MSVLAEILSSQSRAEIFRLLFGSGNQELHVRELERQTGMADATLRQELKKLTRIGIVTARQDGNRTYYYANLSHPLYPEIRNLVLKTNGLTDVLHEALAETEIQVAFVFGSVANGTEKAESDIDLMVIGKLGLRQLGKKLSGIATKLGREINPHVLTPEEFAQRIKSRDHFVTSVLKIERLFVIGTENELSRLGQ